MTYDDERTDTTLGESIAAVSDSALELCRDSREAYLLASVVLEQILKTHAPTRTAVRDDLEDHADRPITFH